MMERKDDNRVPKDLTEAVEHLEETLDDVERAVVMRMSDERDMCLYHHGSGTSMRNGWGLWTGSRLKDWFNAQGIYHADDMSGIIMTSLWRHMHGVAVDVAGQVAYYQAYWRKKGIGFCHKCGTSVEIGKPEGAE